jgi:threonine/homoserine/homoserine lactone efflux protein
LDILGFALAVLLIELTPGPNMAWLSGLAATEGKPAGMAAVAGVAIGLLINGLLAALGLAALLQVAPSLWSALQWTGAAMMTFLAVEAWRGARTDQPTRSAATTKRRAFATGAMINLLNPKAYVFFVAVAPRFMGGATLGLGNAIILAVISASIATIVHVVIVTTGARAQDWLADPRRMQVARRGFALVMLAVAAWFLLADLGG